MNFVYMWEKILQAGTGNYSKTRNLTFGNGKSHEMVRDFLKTKLKLLFQFLFFWN